MPKFAKFAGKVVVNDPDTGASILLEAYKDPGSGGIFAIDPSGLEQEGPFSNSCPNPFYDPENAGEDGRQYLIVWPGRCLPFMIEHLEIEDGYEFADPGLAVELLSEACRGNAEDQTEPFSAENYEGWAREAISLNVAACDLASAREAWIKAVQKKPPTL